MRPQACDYANRTSQSRPQPMSVGRAAFFTLFLICGTLISLCLGSECICRAVENLIPC